MGPTLRAGADSHPGRSLAGRWHSELGRAYGAIERWCAEHQRQPSGVSWEVYGDWAEDPAQRRTDIYLQLRPGAG